MIPKEILGIIHDYRREMERLDEMVDEALRLYATIDGVVDECLKELRCVPEICRARWAVGILSKIAKGITIFAAQEDITEDKLKTLKQINDCLEFTTLRALLYGVEITGEIVQYPHNYDQFEHMIPHGFPF
jgi:hypothetical protein